MEKRSIMICCCLLAMAVPVFAADTLRIDPCDDAVRSEFGELFTLSYDRGEIVRYRGRERVASFGGEKSGKYILQSPVGLCLDEPDGVYCLDRDQYMIFSWDRHLNLRHVIPLDQHVLSPSGFTVTREHEWLVYDNFSQIIYRLSPESNYYQDWGDRIYMGDVALKADENSVLIHYRDESLLIRSNTEGWTQTEYPLPNDLDVHRIFSLGASVFGLASADGVYIWQPEKDKIQKITELANVVFIERTDTGYSFITRDGMVISLP